MSGSLANLLPRLEGLRETGSGQYAARCPAHEDRSPSLSITEVGGGKVLLHCHAGCTVEAIVSAVGLTVSDLFPDAGRNRARDPRTGPTVNWRRAMRECLVEMTAIEAALMDMRNCRLVREDDWQRVDKALERLKILRGAVRGC